MRIENIAPRENITDFKTRGAYTPAKKIDCGNFYLVFVSGVEPNKQENSNSVVSNDIEMQAHEVFKEIDRLLRLAGGSIANVVKAVIYLTDLNQFNIVSPIRAEYFKNSMPVSTMVEVGRLKRDGAKIEIEVTAVIEKL